MSNSASQSEHVTVSVVLAVYNEAAIIEKAIQSLLAQELEPGYVLEILVIDGKSTDGSQEIVEKISRSDPRVRLLINTQRKTPFAFNLGLHEAQGNYLCIFGAHCVYAPDYIRICLQELKARGVVGCGGRTISRPAGDTLSSQLAYWAMSHPFGVSSRSFRTQPEGLADTIPYPVFRKAPLLELGGYDETMIRNQDNDMNYRLREAGYNLYCTWNTFCEYQTRARLRDLLQYAYANGFWCGISFRKEPRSLGMRHYVPFFFFACAMFGLVTVPFISAYPLLSASLVPMLLHLTIGHLVAVRLSIQEGILSLFLMPWIFFVFHLLYGYAFLMGALRGDA